MASELWARSGGKRTLVGLKDGKEGVGGGHGHKFMGGCGSDGDRSACILYILVFLVANLRIREWMLLTETFREPSSLVSTVPRNELLLRIKLRRNYKMEASRWN